MWAILADSLTHVGQPSTAPVGLVTIVDHGKRVSDRWRNCATFGGANGHVSCKEIRVGQIDRTCFAVQFHMTMIV